MPLRQTTGFVQSLLRLLGLDWAAPDSRFANKLTYGLYSAGISDEQKREIVEGVRVPER